MFANVPSATVASNQIDHAAANGGGFCQFTFKGTPEQLVEALQVFYMIVELSYDNRTALIENDKGEFCNVSCNGYVTGWAA